VLVSCRERLQKKTGMVASHDMAEAVQRKNTKIKNNLKQQYSWTLGSPKYKNLKNLEKTRKTKRLKITIFQDSWLYTLSPDFWNIVSFIFFVLVFVFSCFFCFSTFARLMEYWLLFFGFLDVF